MNNLNANYVDVSLDGLVNDINIRVNNQSDEIDGYETSFCEISLYGKQINHVIVNTLRRVILTLIPVYSFHTNDINITKNSSVFNNDMIRLRLSNFPVFLSKQLNIGYKKLKKLEYNQIINPENLLRNAKKLEYRANLGSAEYDITSDDDKQEITNNLTITINVKNISEDSIMNVMTNTQGVKFYLEQEQVSHIYPKPLLIIQLQPKQEFVCTMKSSLNIGLYNATFSPCTICCFEKINENHFNFKLHSKRQISEKDIMIRACKIIKEKIKSTEQVLMQNITNYIDNENNDEKVSSDYTLKGTILIEGEQHTIGNLFSRFLQDHKDITFAGYKVGHPNVNQVDIEYACNSSILTIINDVTKSIMSIFDQIEKKIDQIKNIGYQYDM